MENKKTVICEKCGEGVNPGSGFCTRCGAPIPQEGVEQREPAPPEPGRDPEAASKRIAHDVIISYSYRGERDKMTADAICASLEAEKIRCWIAPRDVLPGTSYGEAIVRAINASRVMVLVFSKNSNLSQHVMREAERAVNRSMPIIPFRIDDVLPSTNLEYFLGATHWLDALTPPMEKHIQKLLITVRQLLLTMESEPGEAEPPPPQAAEAVSPAASRGYLKRHRTPILIALIALVAIAAVVLVLSLVVLDGGIKVGEQERLKAVAYVKEAESLILEERYEEALYNCDQAIELDPGSVSAYYTRGKSHFQLRQYAEAITDFSEAVKLDPDHELACFNRGNSYYELAMYQEAIADYTQTIKLDPADDPAYHNRGNSYYELEMYGEAIADYTKAIELDPDYANSYSGRGKAYYKLGQAENAQADLIKALELDPSLEGAKDILGELGVPGY